MSEQASSYTRLKCARKVRTCLKAILEVAFDPRGSLVLDDGGFSTDVRPKISVNLSRDDLSVLADALERYETLLTHNELVVQLNA